MKKKKINMPPELQSGLLKNIRELCLDGFLEEEGYSGNLEKILSWIPSNSPSLFNKIHDICTEALKRNANFPGSDDHAAFDSVYWLTFTDSDGKPIKLPEDLHINEKLKFAHNDYLVLFARGRAQSDFAGEIRSPAVDELWRRAEVLESILKITRDFSLGSVLLNKD